MIYLTKELDNLIRKEGEKSYPNECCGALLGKFDKNSDAKVTKLLPIVNAREAEEQYHRFQITADDYLFVEKTAMKQGVDVVGFYHSHPDHPAVPSDFDREHALPFYAYVIVAVAKGSATDLTSWRLSQDRKVFNQETINLTSQ